MEPAAGSRALVPLEQPARTVAASMARHDASFIAHLIAMAEQAPQTRNLRRATPADAQVTYERMAAKDKNNGNDNGRILSHSA